MYYSLNKDNHLIQICWNIFEYCISRNFRGFFIFREFRELNLKRENKNSRNIFPSFINEQKVCTTNDTRV